MPWIKEEKYFASLLIWRQKIIQNCLKIDAISKKIACPGR